ncbi:MAG: hypothetical protein QXS54_08720 [Candidatus Methanomethylicaceae archaeon]
MTIVELVENRPSHARYCLIGPMISVERAVKDFNDLFHREPDKVYVIYKSKKDGEQYVHAIYCD